MLVIVPAVYIYLFEISLFGVLLCLFLVYTSAYLIYLARVLVYKRKFSFETYPPYHIEFFKRIFGFETAFLKETFWFSIFFLASAMVLFFDRFYYPAFFGTKTIADHVTLLDLFNRIAIVTGTISLVYFSAISVWFQEKNLIRIKRNLKFQLLSVGFIFIGVLVFGNFFLELILKWWLGSSYSTFIGDNAYHLLIGVLLINFTILLARPLQAIGQTRNVSIWLIATTIIYLGIVVFLGFRGIIQNHYVAFLVKGTLDLLILILLSKRNKIL